MKFRFKFHNPFKIEPPQKTEFTEGELAYFNGQDIVENPYNENTNQFFEWKNSWLIAFDARQKLESIEQKSRHNFEFEYDLTENPVVEKIYEISKVSIAVITFFSCWIYAVFSWGFLIGVGLGWIPSLFIAYIALFLAPILILALIIGFFVLAFLLFKYL